MNGELNAHLVWDSDPAERLDKAQRFIDSECIRLMKPYTPFRTGLMERSATLGTVIGSGRIVYNSPNARYQYYGIVYGPNIPITENGVVVGFWSPPKKHPTNRQLQYSKAKHPQAQRMWFEVTKKKHGTAILRGAAAAAGGRV
ncbi:MAG: hypothetical protein IJM44_01495 [Ruminococcus sp.]|nr:hypothetical protein [Ruminococcus sp.]